MIHTYIIDIRNLSYPVRRELSETLDRQAFLISPTPSSISVTHEFIIAYLEAAPSLPASYPYKDVTGLDVTHIDFRRLF